MPLSEGVKLGRYEIRAHIGAGGMGQVYLAGAQSYQDFFTLWKDADSDLPILIEAKKEFEELK